ncbi:unnamed protein product [Moneuplotes crassus]|uniref:Uncharacterized protein n=1 Tax=Euplotes crassus TaxID=5936 RepID=A0AAD2D3Q5_EUPCR|nr:unnamed protein product [Moneuplotes crassus]
MEPSRPKSLILTKISYISHIVKYYGYIHECAKLFRSLCKASKQEWDKNQRAIVNIIMKNEESRAIMDFGGQINKLVLNHLLKGDEFIYYKISVILKTRYDFRHMAKFISRVHARSTELRILIPNLFKKIIINCSEDGENLLSFVKIYKELGFNLDNLDFICIYELRFMIDTLQYETTLKHCEKSSRCNTMYIDRIKLTEDSILLNYDECKVMWLNLHQTDLTVPLKKTFKILKLKFSYFPLLIREIERLKIKNEVCHSFNISGTFDRCVGMDFSEKKAPLEEFLINCNSALKYFPKVTRIILDTFDSMKMFINCRFFTKDWDENYKNCQKINSLCYSSQQMDGSECLILNKVNVEFIMKVPSKDTKSGKFVILRADIFSVTCYAYSCFEKIDDALLLRLVPEQYLCPARKKIVSKLIQYMKLSIENFELICDEKVAEMDGKYCDVIKKLSVVDGLKVGDICVLDVQQKIPKPSYECIMITTNISQFCKESNQDIRELEIMQEAKFEQEIRKCSTSYRIQAFVFLLSKKNKCVMFKNISEIVKELKNQIVSLHFVDKLQQPLHLTSLDEIFGRSRAFEPSDNQNSGGSKDEESKLPLDGINTIKMNACSKPVSEQTVFLSFVESLSQCRLLEFMSDIALPNDPICTNELLQLFCTNPSLRYLELVFDHKNSVLKVLGALKTNFGLKTLILSESHSYTKQEQRRHVQKAKIFEKGRTELELMIYLNNEAVYPDVFPPFSTYYL